MVPVHGIKPRFVANQATVLSLDDTGVYGSGYKDRTCLVAGSKPAADTSQLSHIILVGCVGIAPTSQRLKAASLLTELTTVIGTA